LILALTADEEGGSFNGIEWLLKAHRELIDAEYCINLDGGEFQWGEGKRLLASIQASEKVYSDFQLETKNPGGHSSRPTRNNAIYHLAGALARLETLSFPAQGNEITRGYLEHMASLSQGQTAADLKAAAKTPPDAGAVARLSESPMYNTLLRTTCVATMLSGGHAPNALPQTARANVNCRVFPGDDPEQVRQTLVRVIADPEVSVTFVEQRAADGSLILPVTVPPSPLRAEIVSAMEKTVGAMWPGIPVVPTMAAGASDGKYLRIGGIPTYGIACMFFDVNDVRAHGKDERIRADFFYEGVDFCDRLIKTIAGPR
jgi:acetylornithine deacetylase/succinyl-diaminopimelate desuccinylase-like protein